jgi:hypothetical protein
MAVLKRARSKVETLEQAMRSTSRTPSPCKTPFLTKDSNVHDFTAFGVDERFRGMGEDLAEMKQALSATLADREEMVKFKEAMALRGMSTVGFILTGTAADDVLQRWNGRHSTSKKVRVSNERSGTFEEVC